MVDVPEGSEDAGKWPRWTESAESTSSVTLGVADSRPPPTIASAEAHSPSAVPASKPRGRRKPKVTLSEIPTASSQRAKKLTTLEKSALDWKSHINSQSDSPLKDELEANRRGGGYLEKVEFLDRVGERREKALEDNMGTKRRRG